MQRKQPPNALGHAIDKALCVAIRWLLQIGRRASQQLAVSENRAQFVGHGRTCSQKRYQRLFRDLIQRHVRQSREFDRRCLSRQYASFAEIAARCKSQSFDPRTSGHLVATRTPSLMMLSELSTVP